MIQRIQSVWLLVAALLSACVFMLNMLSINYVDPATGAEITKGVKLLEYSYMLALLAIILVALPLVAIFMFKNRKRQVNMSLLSIVLNIGFIAFHLTFIKDHYLNTLKIPAQSTSYGIASFIPVAAIVFLAMAISNIRKDEKLVRSADRLR
jgi:hypothetical protein